MLVAHLEAQLQRDLDVPPVPGKRECAGTRADDSVAVGRVINKICAVQDVEKLGPELQISGFTQKPNLAVLVQGEIPVEQAGSGQNAPPHIA